VEIEFDGKLIEERTNALKIIKMGLEQLKKFKVARAAPNPQELDWEIRLYEWILSNPEAPERALEYQQRRLLAGPPYLVPKREVVRQLGWRI